MSETLLNGVGNSLSCQLFNGVQSAIAEHRWNDLLELMPCLLPLENEKHHFWRAFHLLMIHCEEFSIKKQIHFLKLFFANRGGHVSKIGLEFLAHNIPVQDEQVVELINMVRKNLIPSDKSSSLIHCYFDAYAALNDYALWQISRTEISDEDISKEDRNNALIRQGTKVYESLSESFYAFRKLENSESMVNGLIWLIAPLLHVESETKKLINGNEDERLGTRWGLDFIKEYLTWKWDDLHSMRFSAKYLLDYHPNEFFIIRSTLMQVCKSNPSDSLVLDYVEIITKKMHEESSNEQHVKRSKAKKNKDCILNDVNVKDFVQGIALITHLLEFPCWQKSLRLWKMLTELLNTFHKAWLNCWDCKHCSYGRTEIQKICGKLTLWPFLFWDEKPSLNSNKDAKIAYHIAYSSFIFGYNPKTFFKIAKRLKNSVYTSIQEKLLDDTKQDGPHKEELLQYLKKFSTECYNNSSQDANADSSEVKLMVLHDGSKPVSSIFKKKEPPALASTPAGFSIMD